MPSERSPRLFLQAFVPALLIMLAVLLLFGRGWEEQGLTRLRSQQSLAVGLGSGALQRHLLEITRDLAFLAGHSALRQALDDPSAERLARLGEDFVVFSRSKEVYDKLRWIDEQGRERVRVDLADGRPRVRPAEELQDKGRRYFYTETMRLQPGEIYVSPLDLNMEQDQLEQPHKPTLRVATPVVDSQGRRRGIVILNYRGADLLEAYARAGATAGGPGLMLANGEGYWLKGPDPAEEWGFMLERPDLTLAERAPAAWRRISLAAEGQELLGDGLWTWQTVHPLQGVRLPGGSAATEAAAGAEGEAAEGLAEAPRPPPVWKAISRVPREELVALRQEVWLVLGLVAAVLAALLAFGCRRLAAAWAAQQLTEQALRHEVQLLEAGISGRTAELAQKAAALAEAHAELARREEELRALAGITSRELPSPLVNLQGFGNSLAKSLEELRQRLGAADVPPALRQDLARQLDERMPASLHYIRAGSRKLERMLEGVLRLSRAAAPPLACQPVDMNGLVHGVLAGYARVLQQSHAVVSVESLPMCLGDAAQLREAFTQLVDNAIKYRDPARPLALRIGGSADGGRARYVVADSGVGIPAEQQARVWLPFQRLDPQGPVRGEGLGLSLVRRIVERQRGSVRLESTPGGGSRVHVELPAA